MKVHSRFCCCDEAASFCSGCVLLRWPADGDGALPLHGVLEQAAHDNVQQEPQALHGAGEVRSVSVRHPLPSIDVGRCLHLFSQRDHDMYMIALLLPPQHRIGYLALQAFNIETAAVQDQARDQNVARLRLRWWQDELDRLFRREEAHHPISQVLARVLQKSKLSKSWFNRLISARVSRGI